MGQNELYNDYCDWERIRADFSSEITSDVVYQYLTAPQGYSLGLYYDNGNSLGLYYDDNGVFSVYVGDAVGNEIAIEERAIAVTTCPGLGNIDLSLLIEGWAEYDEETCQYREIDGHRNIGDIYATIRECCQDGDVTDYRDEIINDLFVNLIAD